MQSLWLRGDVELSVDSRLTGESVSSSRQGRQGNRQEYRYIVAIGQTCIRKDDDDTENEKAEADVDEKEAARKHPRRLPRDRAFHGHQSCHISIYSIVIASYTIQFNAIDPETPHANKVRFDHTP